MNSETQADIAAALRQEAEDCPDVERAGIYNRYADRIEAAAKREEEFYLDLVRDAMNMAGHEQYMRERAPVGNAAKLREAVKAVVDVGYPHNFQKEAPHIRGYCYDITRAIDKCFAVLSAPPRNCDAFSKAEVLEVLEYRSFSKEDTIEWLFEEAKGDDDEQKRHEEGDAE